MRWTVHGERPVYQSAWVNLHLVDVEIPDGPRFEHHAVRMPFPAVGTVLHDPEQGVLLLYRHRFIGDFWGWEIPAGRVEDGESLADAARRECVEEVGWAPGTLDHLVTYHYAGGLSDGRFALFLGRDVVEVGPPTDVAEAERIAWVPVADLRRLIADGEVADGLSLSALLWVLAFDRLDGAAAIPGV
jgi:8-oxo-dGTP pyrophosphatase MutT (NUDIX family)